MVNKLPLTHALVAGVCVFGFASTSAAQNVRPLTPLNAGACEVTVVLTPATGSASSVELEIEGGFARRLPVNGAQTRTPPHLNLPLAVPLRQGWSVRARELGPDFTGEWSAPVIVGAGTSSEPCAEPSPSEPRGDGREPFDASIYIGAAFDNFAPASIANYRDAEGKPNPQVGGFSQRSEVVGANFEFRAWGRDYSPVQFWITGETVHGVRSADLDCTTEARPPLCEKLNEGSVKDKFLYALEHATAFEAGLAARLEFRTLQGDTSFPTRLYGVARVNVLMLDDASTDAWDAYHVGIGALNTSGPFAGSYLEAGWGRSDLFFSQLDRVVAGQPTRTKWRRLKIDGTLTWAIGDAISKQATFWRKFPRVFLQFYGDFDPSGVSADSMQTYFGFQYNLAELSK